MILVSESDNINNDELESEEFKKLMSKSGMRKTKILSRSIKNQKRK